MPHHKITEVVTQRVADVSTAVAVTGFSVTLSDVDYIVSICAGIAAIISALAAAYYYISKAKGERRRYSRNDKL